MLTQLRNEIHTLETRINEMEAEKKELRKKLAVLKRAEKTLESLDDETVS